MTAKLLNKNELAEILKKEERTLTRWQEEGMPIAQKAERRGQQNLYDLAEIVAWIINREVQKKSGKSSQQSEDNKSRFEAIRMEMAELELSRAKAEVIFVDEVERAWSALVLKFKNKLLSVPARMASQIMGLKKPHQVETLVKKIIYEVLNELSNTPILEEGAGSDGAGEDASRTSARAKRKPVGGRKAPSKQRSKR